MKKLLIASLTAAMFLAAQAETLPEPGVSDARIRTVTYNPKGVVRLNTYYGVSTHVQFSESEQIKDVAVGDDLAWKVIPRGNNLFIKPVAKEGDTNITVITTKRTYQFVVMVVPDKGTKGNAWANRDLTYSLSFRYVDDEQAAAAARAKAEKDKAQRADISNRLQRAPGQMGHNTDYWVAGDSEVSPSGAYDDGRFVYFIFRANAEMPAIYEVDDKGQESLVNTHVMSGNTISVHRMAPSYIFRKGNSVASVINKSFNRKGGVDNLTGTVAPDVERVVKEVN
ncbi:MAG: P-type conjugative transfer protein VirB9 [Bacteroidetes bacterium]|nr:P-type conjugative transfer protein VirB9 [Bacteroidota bacterium]